VVPLSDEELRMWRAFSMTRDPRILNTILLEERPPSCFCSSASIDNANFVDGMPSPNTTLNRASAAIFRAFRQSGDHLRSAFPGRHAATAMALVGVGGAEEEGQSIERRLSGWRAIAAQFCVCCSSLGLFSHFRFRSVRNMKAALPERRETRPITGGRGSHERADRSVQTPACDPVNVWR